MVLSRWHPQNEPRIAEAGDRLEHGGHPADGQRQANASGPALPQEFDQNVDECGLKIVGKSTEKSIEIVDDQQTRSGGCAAHPPDGGREHVPRLLDGGRNSLNSRSLVQSGEQLGLSATLSADHEQVTVQHGVIDGNLLPLLLR